MLSLKCSSTQGNMSKLNGNLDLTLLLRKILITDQKLILIKGKLKKCSEISRENLDAGLGGYRFVLLTYFVHPKAINLYLWLIATQVAELKSLAHKPMISYVRKKQLTIN